MMRAREACVDSVTEKEAGMVGAEGGAAKRVAAWGAAVERRTQRRRRRGWKPE